MSMMPGHSLGDHQTALQQSRKGGGGGGPRGNIRGMDKGECM